MAFAPWGAWIAYAIIIGGTSIAIELGYAYSSDRTWRNGYFFGLIIPMIILLAVSLFIFNIWAIVTGPAITSNQIAFAALLIGPLAAILAPYTGPERIGVAVAAGVAIGLLADRIFYG